jgi:hypothetical protein
LCPTSVRMHIFQPCRSFRLAVSNWLQTILQLRLISLQPNTA